MTKTVADQLVEPSFPLDLKVQPDPVAFPHHKATPKISIIVPTYNRKKILARTLPRLLQQDFPAHQYEIIVVVDGSNDGTVEWLRQLQHNCVMTVIWQVHQGQPAALNRGLHAARGEIVLFLDDDILSGSTLLKEHIAAHRIGQTAMVFGPILSWPENPEGVTTDLLRKTCDEYFAERVSMKESQGWRFAMGNANTSGPRHFLLAQPGFLESLPRGHDVEFGFRNWKSSVPFRCARQAIGFQVCDKNAEELIKDAASDGQAEVEICRLHPEFRYHSLLTRLATRSSWKHLLCHLAICLPAVDPLLVLWARLAAQLRSIPGLRRASFYMLQAGLAVSFLRGATSIVGSARALRREFGVRVAVLLYHHIGRKVRSTYHSLTLSPEEFTHQMAWLDRHGYMGISAADWLAWCREGKVLPPKPVVITFDDAFVDITKYALPILQQHGFQATVFVVTSQIGGLSTWDEANGYASLPLMTAAQIREWSDKNIDFGAHSRTHCDLRTLSELELRQELEGSRKELAEVTGKPVTSFAYPYGHINELVCEITRQYFPLAFTCAEGFNSLNLDPILLRRTCMEPYYTLADPFARILLGFNPLQRFRMYMGLLRQRVWLTLSRRHRAGEISEAKRCHN